MNYFELYPGDYLRDTTRLSLIDHGAYLKLLMAYYAEEQPLPADEGELFVIVSAVSSADKAAVRKVAVRFFPVGDDGLRRNSRADEEIAKAQKRIQTARANGSKNKPSKNPAANPPGIPTGPPSGTTQRETRSGEALHVPDPIDQQQKQKQPQAAMPDVPDWIHPDAWTGFADSRKKLRFPMTPRAAQLVIRELDKLRATGADPNAVLDQSTRNGWRDVFPLKTQGQAHASTGRLAAVDRIEANIRADRAADSNDRTIPGEAIRLVG